MLRWVLGFMGSFSWWGWCPDTPCLHPELPCIWVSLVSSCGEWEKVGLGWVSRTQSSPDYREWGWSDLGESRTTWKCFVKKLCNPKIMLFLFTYSLFTISFSSFLLHAGDDLGPLTLASWPLRENTGHVQWTGWDVIPLLLGGN